MRLGYSSTGEGAKVLEVGHSHTANCKGGADLTSSDPQISGKLPPPQITPSLLGWRHSSSSVFLQRPLACPPTPSPAASHLVQPQPMTLTPTPHSHPLQALAQAASGPWSFPPPTLSAHTLHPSRLDPGATAFVETLCTLTQSVHTRSDPRALPGHCLELVAQPLLDYWPPCV